MSTEKPEDSKPNKKKRVVKSKQLAPTSSSSLSADDDLLPLTKLEQANIDSLLAQALVRHKSEELTEKKNKLKDINHLSSLLEEYLSCFLVVGYSLQDEKVCIFNANSSKDESALVDYLRATFLEIVNNRP